MLKVGKQVQWVFSSPGVVESVVEEGEDTEEKLS